MKLDIVTRQFLFILAALALCWLDSLIPLPGAAPGADLGLSLTVTVFVIWICGVREGILTTLAWLILDAVIISGFSRFLFSAGGCVLAFLCVAGLKYILKEDQIWIAGCLGGLVYGLGQLIMEIWLKKMPSYLLFFPMEMVYSVFGGLLMGLCTQLVIKKGSKKWKTIFK